MGFMKNDNSATMKYVAIAVGVAALLGLLYYVFYVRDRNVHHKKESYAELQDRQYLFDNITPAPLPTAETLDSYDQYYNGNELAHYGEPAQSFGSKRSTHRKRMKFEQLRKPSSVPHSASYITGYDVDIADPKFYFFGARTPNITLKDRVRDLADPYRGDIPIRKHDNVCLITNSVNGRESQRFSAMFNPAFDQRMRDLSAIADYETSSLANKNFPQYVSREETVMDMQ